MTTAQSAAFRMERETTWSGAQHNTALIKGSPSLSLSIAEPFPTANILGMFVLHFVSLPSDF